MSLHEPAKKTISANPPWFDETAAIGWWPKAIALLGALLLGGGGFIALFHPVMLVSPHDEINGAVHIYAGYLASRNLALAVLLIAALALGAKRMLNNLLLLAAFIQLFDAIIDALEARWPIVPGVLVLSILFFAASAAHSGAPFWSLQAWKQSQS
jgi:hypothetical protein